MLKPQSAKTIHEKSPSIFTICWISWEFQVCAKNPDILEKLVTLKYTWDHTYQEKKSWSKSSETCVPVPILLLMIWTWVKLDQFVSLGLSFHIFKIRGLQFSSVQFSHSVMSDSLRPHELQHARPPCPSPSPGLHSDSRPSSPWCHPAISSWVVPFSSCPQSLPASESFPMSQLFSWGGQSTGASALASFLPKKS